MRVLIFGFILLKVMKLIAGTCVLESEFGFILNCNFKKSGLFRVRNLGGLKAHFGLGFSLGDELGFGESLGNLEGNRRRALNYKTGFINKVGIVSPPKTDASTVSQSQINHMRNFNQNTSSMTEVMFLPLGVPTFRPIPKNVNNLVRRNDVILSNGISNNNRMTDFYYKAEKETANTTNLSSGIDTGTSFIEENKTYSTLNNISNSIYNENVESYKTAPVTKSVNSTPGRSSKVLVVMNAPKEYYPSGYDKNFDDNFKSKVDLPPTDFACADQKYFPGLYANIDLGCMVFHVCAITDGGIIMKSFLCPESTLFDQSILKCNWWFYVDCNNSIYDSNIPISKSYQLMKSLSYFSNFTKMHTLDKEAS